MFRRVAYPPKILLALATMTSLMSMHSFAESERKPQDIFDTFCFSCHGTGWENAPVVGDNFAWEERREQGLDVLLQNTIKGFGGMPEKGSCMDCSDAELKATIEWMSAE